MSLLELIPKILNKLTIFPHYMHDYSFPLMLLAATETLPLI